MTKSTRSPIRVTYALPACLTASLLCGPRPDQPARSAEFVRPTEMAKKSEWVKANLLDAKARVPFSFVYGGVDSERRLASWPAQRQSSSLDAHRTRHVMTWTEPGPGLEVRCVAVEYGDYPAVEWTVSFRNRGIAAIPILEKVQGMDTGFDRDGPGEFVLHHWKGDTYAPDLYEPLQAVLGPGSVQRFAPVGGRGSNGAFPYYNLAMPGGGVILAVGWPGQWAATFTRDGDRGLRIVAGQETTHLVLRPDEQVRTPLIALVFWEGRDLIRSQNLWRRWMFAHNVPRMAGGDLPPTSLFANTSLQFNEMCNADETNQKLFIDRYHDEGVPIDYWWMDAGWYPCDGHWPKTGTWEPDPVRFPRGLRAIGDHAKARGTRTLVWFEPERVAGGTWLAANHPEWLLGGRLLNLGDPRARGWLTDHVDRVIREQGIGLYRQDFNMDPLADWRTNDPPDRRGMTENLHVQGYLAYWDELRRRHPGLIIDSCASGGRRNDLETMRRAIALHPTDYNYADLAAKQAFHSSLFAWLPCYGSNTVPVDTVNAYAFRSGHAMNVVIGYDMRRRNLDYPLLRKLAREWRIVALHYYGDYYPLTPYSRATDRWLAWQFDRPGQGDGIVEVFRRELAPEATAPFRLGALDSSARYRVTDLDSGRCREAEGQELKERGLTVTIDPRPGAAILRYQRLGSASAR